MPWERSGEERRREISSSGKAGRNYLSSDYLVTCSGEGHEEGELVLDFSIQEAWVYGKEEGSRGGRKLCKAVRRLESVLGSIVDGSNGMSLHVTSSM